MLDRVLRLIIPTPLQAFGSVVLATAILIGIYQGVVIPRIYQVNQVSQGQIDQSFHSGLAILDNYSFVQTGVQVAFWALVGIACYIIYLAITDAIIETRNEVVIDTEYANRGTMASWLHHYGKQIIAAALLVIFLVLVASVLLPFWLSLFDSLVFDSFSIASLTLGLAAWLGLALTVYAAWILSEVALIADRL
jgi:hypothetical protein